MTYSITRFGETLDPSKYTIDPENKTFSTKEGNLVFDFSGEYGWTFDTGSFCNFDTLWGCNFKTGSECTFDTGSQCNFTTSSRCVIIRRDIFEVIQPEKGVQIQLNGYGVLGYEIVPQKKTITIDGKDIVISEESFNELKRQLTGE